METVGLYLRDLRDAAGLTQDEAADLAGVDKKTIRRWETGSNEPKLTDLYRYVRSINGSIQHVVNLLLDDISPYVMTDEEKQEINRIAQTRDPEDLRRLFDVIRIEQRHNPLIVELVSSFLAGLLLRGRRHR